MNKIITIILFTIAACASAFGYTKQETIEIVASTLYHEARGEIRYGGLEAVASVIQNRAEQKRWKKLGLAGVCLQKYQFSCHNKGFNKARPKNVVDKSAYNKCVKIAKAMVEGRFIATVNANHYCTNDCKVSWKSKLKNPVVVGHHTFGNL